MFCLILRILLNARQQIKTILLYVGIPHTSHDKIVIMWRDVMIIDEDVKIIRISVIFLMHCQFLNHTSILNCRVNNIESIFLQVTNIVKYCILDQ